MKKTLENALFNISGVNGVGLSPDGTAIRVYTDRHLPHGDVPERMGDYPVETTYIGKLTPSDAPLPEVVEKFRTRRYRPVVGGISIGDLRTGAGTLGGVIRDTNTGQKYIISNNHVLAKADTIQYPMATVGDPIIQPGGVDGGSQPTDTIGSLFRWIPINCKDPVDPFKNNNLVDAALAIPTNHTYASTCMLESSTLDTFRLGPTRSAENNLIVKKYGRTSSITWGKIVDTDIVAEVYYGGELGTIRFTDQIMAEMPAEAGDSGSLLLDTDNNVIGLVFAGGDGAAICNKIRNVEAMLEGSDLNLEFTGDQNEPPPDWSSAITPPEPPSYDCSDPYGIPGSVRCDGTTKLMCHNNRWITIQENSPECGYLPPHEPPDPPVTGCTNPAGQAGDTYCRDDRALMRCDGTEWSVQEHNAHLCNRDRDRWPIDIPEGQEYLYLGIGAIVAFGLGVLLSR